MVKREIVKDLLESVIVGGVCAGGWTGILWLVDRFSPLSVSPLWGLVAFPITALAYWLYLQAKDIEELDIDCQ